MSSQSTDRTPATWSVDVRDLAGATVGTVDLPSEWFGAEVNLHVMHLVVTAQLAAKRQGTHKTKTRAEVSGGGRKPHNQKGGGRARQGSIRAPQFVGGGHAKARTPSDWSKRINKKVKRAALRSALSDRAANSLVIVVRDLAFASPRTKDAVKALSALGVDARNTLVVLGERGEATERSFRNLPGVHTLSVDQLNTYDVLRSDVLVIDEAALALIGTGRRTSDTAPVEA